MKADVIALIVLMGLSFFYIWFKMLREVYYLGGDKFGLIFLGSLPVVIIYIVARLTLLTGAKNV